MSEMIERAARAIFDANQADWSCGRRERVWQDPAALDVRRVAYDLARAAIGAMREPTPDMVCAAMSSRNRTSRARYYAMIDAALNGR